MRDQTVNVVDVSKTNISEFVIVYLDSVNNIYSVDVSNN